MFNVRFLNLFYVLVFLFFSIFIFTSTHIVNADGLLPEEGGESKFDCPEGKNCGNYSLNDFVVVMLKVSEWILGIVGSLALLVFVYAGVMLLISAGNSEKITQAKQTIISAIIGLVVVFSSYMIIQFVMESLSIVKKDGQFIQQDIKKGNWNVVQ